VFIGNLPATTILPDGLPFMLACAAALVAARWHRDRYQDIPGMLLFLGAFAVLVLGDRLHGSTELFFRDRASAPWPQVVDICGYALVVFTFLRWSWMFMVPASCQRPAWTRRIMRQIGAFMIAVALALAGFAVSIASILNHTDVGTWYRVGELTPPSLGSLLLICIGIQMWYAGRPASAHQ